MIESELNRDGGSHLLSFVTDVTGTYLSIHADLNGVNFLIEELQQLRESLEANDCPHTHLFSSESFGVLTSAKLDEQKLEFQTVEHVKIYGWNQEWAVRHRLKRERRNNGEGKNGDMEDETKGPVKSKNSDEGSER